MRRRGLAVAMTAACMLVGCNGGTKTVNTSTNHYEAEEGTVVGTADFEKEEPDIQLSNIYTYIGEDIDYSSGVEILNADKFDEFQMWVDATGVDMLNVGSYEATYKFIYDGKTTEKKIVVTVMERDVEQSGENNVSTENIANNNSGGNVNTQGTNGNAGTQQNTQSTNGNAGTQQNTQSTNGNAGTQQNTQSTNGNAGTQQNTQSTNGNAGTQQNTQSTNQNASTQQNNNAGTSNQVQNTVNNSTTKPAQEKTTTKRQIITSAWNGSTTKAYTIGSMTIELLSGNTVKLKCTSAKYIVSTRTDISTVTRNGVEYKVYKLIVTYNTGKEQTLESYEEKQG